MTPKDLRQALPLFEEFSERFTPLLVDDRRTESRRERAKAYLRGLLLDAESTKTAEAIALKVHGDPSQVRMTQVFLGQSAWPDEPPREELVRWVGPGTGQRSRHADRGRVGLPQVWRQERGRGPAVLRRDRQDRQLPGGRLPGLRQCRRGTRCWTSGCICRRTNGPTTPRAAKRPACPKASSSAPSRSWPRS